MTSYKQNFGIGNDLLMGMMFWRSLVRAFWSLTVISALLLPAQVRAAIPTAERQVLLNLYTSTNGASWTNKTGWGGAAGTECTWYGITCIGDTVTEVYLSDNGLSGTLPALSGLTNLGGFIVDSNQLTGSIPALSGLTNLGGFIAYDNQLTGSIPALSGLTNLEYFGVFNNQLTGSIPALAGLTNLEYFLVSDNQLTGSLPAIPQNPYGIALCNNHLTSGDAANDAAWTAKTGDWLSCQTASPTPVVATPVITESGVSTAPYKFTVTLTTALPTGHYIAINFDDMQGGWLAQTSAGGHFKLSNTTGNVWSANRKLDYPGIRYFRAGIFNAAGELQGSNSANGTCTLAGCLAAVVQPVVVGDPALSGSGSVLLQGVDMASGNFHMHATDLSVSGKGPDFALVRHYNALTGVWGFNLDMQLTKTAFNLIEIGPREDGRTQTFYKDMDQHWYPLNPGNFDQLVQAPNGTFTLYTQGNLLYQFDAPTGALKGALKAIADRDGNTLTFSHDANQRISGGTDASGRSYTLTRDSAGRITKAADFTQAADFPARYVAYTYNADGMLASVRNLRGKTHTYTYLTGATLAERNRLASFTDARTKVQLSLEYNLQRRVKTITNGVGSVTSIVYSSTTLDGQTVQVTAVTRPTTMGVNGANVNNNVAFVVDAKRTKVIERIDAYGYAAKFRSKTAYKPGADRNLIAEMALPETKIRPSNAKTTLEYSTDGKGNPTRVTDTLERSTAISWGTDSTQINLTPMTTLQRPGVTQATTFSMFTSAGKPERIEDPLGHTTEPHYSSGLLASSKNRRDYMTAYQYDASGNLRRVTDPNNNYTENTYDALGRVLTERNKRGFITTYTYDANGNVLTVKEPNGSITTNTYDASDNLLTVKDPRGNTTTYVYDAINRKIEEKYTVTVNGSPVVRTLKYEYDAMGRISRMLNEKGLGTTNVFNSRGKTEQKINPLSQIVAYTYDANGNVTSETDAEGRKTTKTYDALDRLEQVKDALGNYEAYTYNTAGLLATKRDARGKTTRYEYDALGRMTKVIDKENGVDVATQATYDPNGNLLTTTDRKSQTTTYTYDALDRMVSLTDARNRVWQFKYDANGNLIKRTTPGIKAINYTYDNNEQLKTVITYPDGATVSYDYDANGNRISMVDGNGTTTYTYDEVNRLTGVTDAFGNAVAYDYDAVGALAKLTYPGNKAVNYTYDNAGRLKTLVDWLSHTTRYTRDDTGAITEITYGNGTKVAKSYDAAGRLTSLINRNAANTVISSHSLTLDGAGNPLSATLDLPLLPGKTGNTAEQLYDASNRLTSVGGKTITHDADGRITQDASGTAAIQYAYNAQDLITQVTQGGVLTDRYTYDGDGRRIARTTGTTTTRYVLDPTGGNLYRVLAETNASNAVQRYYLYGEGLVAQISGTTHRYYHFDPSGNTLALTDDSGVMTDSYAYEPFGNITAQGSTVNPFRFVGQYGVMDDGNGLNHMRARYYRPDVRRFVSLDALYGEINDPMALNRYQYVGGNPMVGIDPSGLNKESALADFDSDLEKWRRLLSKTKSTQVKLIAARRIHSIKKKRQLVVDVDNLIKTNADYVASRITPSTGDGQELLLEMSRHKVFDKDVFNLALTKILKNKAKDVVLQLAINELPQEDKKFASEVLDLLGESVIDPYVRLANGENGVGAGEHLWEDYQNTTFYKNHFAPDKLHGTAEKINKQLSCFMLIFCGD